ncbi:MAG: RHS repeat-associated core domain-containing protein, partial [Planctomycetes bacterium]|nr:RHS repeat-associated core domain-containing protein [Planctomycetota bacterium]
GGVRDQTYYFHFDATGSVIALSDSDGDTAEIYRYDVYGAFQIYAPNGTTERQQSVCGNPYLFTARRWDQETALYYYRARMYNPQIGRFCQTDPIGYADGINWYAYCGNNPVMYTDPTGENVFGGMVSWIAGNGWDNSYDMGASEASQLGGAAWQGAKDGGAIALNEYTFGLHSGLNSYADQKVAEYGTAGQVSKWSAIVSREAAAFVIGGQLTKGVSSMKIGIGGSAVGKSHMAYQVNNVALNGLNYGRGSAVQVGKYLAAESMEKAAIKFSVPIMNKAAVLATKGMQARNCWAATGAAWKAAGGIQATARVAGAIGLVGWSTGDAAYQGYQGLKK